MKSSVLSILKSVACEAVKPRKKLSVSEWADQHRILTSKQSGEPGKWRTSRNPMLREIMDCLSVHSPVKKVTCMKPSQAGLTEACINWFGYIIHHCQFPAMAFMPTESARDTWKAQKLNPLFTDTPVIREIIGGNKSRDASNSKEIIDFPGGILFLAGGNSPNSYAQKSVRFLMMDDLDRFPSRIDEEGDPVELARSRVKSFPRHKILLASTPTVKGASLIEREFLSGDQRYYHVSCPQCGHRQRLKWANVRANEKLTEAWYVCEENGCVIDEKFKGRMLAGGEWIPERPEIRDRSYAWSSIYSPPGIGLTWLDLVITFKKVHNEPVQLKTFVNQNLGEPWEDQTDNLKSNDIARRAEEYTIGEIPPGCLALTCGIDTQDGWLAITLLGWGASDRHYLVDWVEIVGDTTSMQVWDELEAWLHQPRYNAYGNQMYIRAAGIDSRGHRGEQVKNFVSRHTLKIPVYALQGSTSRIGRAISQTGSYPAKSKSGKTIKSGYCTWSVGTEFCKDYIFAHLANDGDRPQSDRIFHFPQGLNSEYYDGLLSETYDPEKKRYIPRIGSKYKRNEPLDTMVYAWSVAQHRDINIGRGRTGRPDAQYWKRLEVMLEPETKKALPVAIEKTLDEVIKIEPIKIIQRPVQQNRSNKFARKEL